MWHDLWKSGEEWREAADKMDAGIAPTKQDHLLPHVEDRCFCESLSATQPQSQSDSRIERCTCVSKHFHLVCNPWIPRNHYEYDVVLDRGHIRKRKKKPSKRFRDNFGAYTALDRGGDNPGSVSGL